MNYEINSKDLDQIENYLKTKKDGKAFNKLNQKPPSKRFYNIKNNKSTRR